MEFPSKFLWITVLLGIVVVLLCVWLSMKLHAYLTQRKCTSKRTMNGKTVIITGSESGIGKETALDLAKRGARVIMACYNMDLAHETKDWVVRKSQNSHVTVKPLDLSSFQSVRSFAEEINSTETKLDVLIHNAGVMLPSKNVSVDGLNLTLATNHFGPFLLTHLLIDLLKETGQSRIVVVTSSAHKLANAAVDPNDPNPLDDNPSQLRNFQFYSMSKFACVLCAMELSRRLEGTGVTVNTVHPGTVGGTSISKQPPKWLLTILSTAIPYIKNPQQGAQTSIYLAVSEEVEGVSGKYFVDCKEERAAKKAYNKELAETYWTVSEQIVQLRPSDPHIKKIVTKDYEYDKY